MHDNKPGALVSYKGHTLTVLEWHALVYGTIGLLAGLSDEVGEALRHELPYVLGSFVVSFLAGRALRSD